ncbi:hypothetical protein Pcinc_031672 [Petrolisthes cinctipes]|uniref:Uncharacterized protein n=1 Tax=Petrolisthes cinctipes TaxID=88211 RepID=A0AAE1EW35_PETCI|nr:hypothetical protein Pcinc_031672 [Petrolisthes cinctipes]
MNSISVPAGCARGGKAAKGAGGGYGGTHGLSNFSAREMTWEDVVLAMQLSAMCFGALLALCVVACCAYKICGPAEEIDYSPRYSVFKSDHPRLPPEILREIYTLPATTPRPPQPPPQPVVPPVQRDSLTAPSTPAPHPPRLAESGRTGSAGSILEGGFRALVGRETLLTRAAAIAAHLPNGRPRGPPGGELPQHLTPPPPRRPPLTHQNTRPDPYRPPRLLNLNCMLEGGRPRLLTLSSMSSTRAVREVAGRGAANRLAAHDQTSSTLDLARAAAASIPSLSYTHRSLSEPQTSVV